MAFKRSSVRSRSFSTKLSLDAIRVPGSFIEMSGSRFSQSKWTNFVGGGPHKMPPLLHLGSLQDKSGLCHVKVKPGRSPPPL